MKTISRKEFIKYFAGYLIGIGIFVITIPAGLITVIQISDLEMITAPILRVWLGNAIALLLFSMGLFYVIWSNIFLLRIGKGGPTEGLGVSISPKTKNLVTTGPYRYSRNPMAFGMLSVYYAIAVFFNSLAGLCIVVFITVTSITYLKISEEKRLKKDFGDEYIKYVKEVSMIVPLPKKLYKNVAPIFHIFQKGKDYEN